MPKLSPVRSLLAGANVRPLRMSNEDVEDFRALEQLGINMGSPEDLATAAHYFGMDAAPDPVATVYPLTIPNQIAYLQAWMPGFVVAALAAQTIDKLVGVQTIGAWEDEEVIQSTMEYTGIAQLYGDYTNIPLASWNVGFERRTIVRFEEGLRVGKLEEARTGRAGVNSAARKRIGAQRALDFQRNRIGFWGFYNGANRTYGFLNDPGLPAYVTVAAGASASTLWSTKTFLEITADIRAAVGALIAAGQGMVQAGPMAQDATPMVLALPLGADNFMGVTSEFGNSVAEWLRKTYPRMRIVTAPELVGANGGANVFYLYVENIEDGESDDGGQTFVQMVPERFRMVGTEQGAKAYVEDFTNATAGVMCKRPFLVVRRSGI